MSKRLDYGEVLLLFAWGMDKLTRPTLRNLLAGYEEFEHRPDVARLLRRMQQQRLVASSGDGKDAQYRLTALGRLRIRRSTPEAGWRRHWDGLWRVVTFDLPESRRRDRYLLWRALRDRKLGMLQRSVWVWPHRLEPILAEIIEAEGVPECFCGFESRRLFLCNSEEVVQAAWDFEEIGRRHATYLKRLPGAVDDLMRASDLAQVARAARIEQQLYEEAFWLDPLLPRALLPKGYQGHAVHEQHGVFERRVRRRVAELADRA